MDITFVEIQKTVIMYTILHCVVWGAVNMWHWLTKQERKVAIARHHYRGHAGDIRDCKMGLCSLI